MLSCWEHAESHKRISNSSELTQILKKLIALCPGRPWLCFGFFFAHSNFPLGTLYRNLTTLSAFNIFVAWIKIFKYLSFNKTMIQLSGTLSAVITFSINIIFITYLPYFQKIFFSQQKIYLDFLWCFSSSTLLLFNLDSCCLVFK